MKCPKGIATYVASLTLLLVAGLIALPSGFLTSTSSAAQAQSDNDRAADVDIQILADKQSGGALQKLGRAVRVAILSSTHFDAASETPRPSLWRARP